MAQNREEWYKNSRIMIRIIGVISAVAIALLIWLIYFNPFTIEEQIGWVSQLPLLNSTLNSLSAICVVAGVLAIKSGKTLVHMRFMGAAFVFSTLFLVSYLIYHSLHGDTKFLGEGAIRYIYFAILITHIITSIIALPVILVTFFFALTQKFALHRSIVRVTVPLWLYVSVTGVLVYVILKNFG